MDKQLTTKDLMALNELMTFENWMSIKMKACSDVSEDKSQKTMFKDMAKKHCENHGKLLYYLKQHSKVGGSK